MGADSDNSEFGTTVKGDQPLVSRWANVKPDSDKPRSITPARPIPRMPANFDSEKERKQPPNARSPGSNKASFGSSSEPVGEQVTSGKIPSRWASAALSSEPTRGPRSSDIPSSPRARRRSHPNTHDRPFRPRESRENEHNSQDRQRNHPLRDSAKDHQRNAHSNESVTPREPHPKDHHKDHHRSRDHRPRDKHSRDDFGKDLGACPWDAPKPGPPPEESRRRRYSRNRRRSSHGDRPPKPDQESKPSQLPPITSWEEILKNQGSWADEEADNFHLR